MDEHRQAMDRRDFLRRIGTGLAAAGLCAAAGCEETSLDNTQSGRSLAGDETNAVPAAGSQTDGTTPTYRSVDGVISANHDHTVYLSGAEQAAGEATTLLLTMGAGHTHTVSLSSADVLAIANGTRVSLTSTYDFAHDHGVTFN